MKKLYAKLKCFLVLGVISTTLSAQDLPPLKVRAESVGPQKSAVCWVSSVYIQGAMTANPSVPNAAATLQFAQDLQSIYNSYGNVLVGQNTFNSLIRNASDYFKSQPESRKIELWKMCQEAWKG